MCGLNDNLFKTKGVHVIKDQNNKSLPEEHVNHLSSQHPAHGVEELSSPIVQTSEHV
jgi:hypothetical protein